MTATEKSLSVKVKTEGVSKYRVQFIGHRGQVLTELNEPSASYTFKGHEGYVRAKVDRNPWRLAWVQPVPVPGRPSSAHGGWVAPFAIAGLLGYRVRESRRRHRRT